MKEETYLEKIDRLNKYKGELRLWQLKELSHLAEIQTFLLLQGELNDKIEPLEEEIRQMRYSAHPKTFFHRMMNR